MIVYVNENHEIKAVGTTTDESLVALEINDEDNPFKDWSVAKICCYKVNVNDGIVTMMTPYRPSSTLDYIDEIGKESEANADKAQAFDILIGEVE